MTASSPLAIPSSTSQVSKLARVDLRKSRAETDLTRQFRLSNPQESRKPEEPEAGRNSENKVAGARPASKPTKTQEADSQGEPGADVQDVGRTGSAASEGQGKVVADGPSDQDEARTNEAQEAPEAQDARRGKDAPDTATVEEPGRIDEATAAKQPRGGAAADSTKAHSAQEASTAGPNGGLIQAAKGLENPSRPLTIRELNDALASVDRRLLPTDLLRDLGLGGIESSRPAPSGAAQDSPSGWGNAPVTSPTSGSDAVASGRSPDAEEDGSPREATDGQAGPSLEKDKSLSRREQPPLPLSPPSQTQQATGGAAIAARTEAVASIGAQQIQSPRSPFKMMATAAPAQRGAPDAEAFQAQVSRGLSAAVAQRGGNVTLRLRPEALGSLRIEVELRDAVVAVRFHASSDAAGSLLDSSLRDLRSTLEGQGLRVQDMAVRVSADARPGHTAPQSQDHHQNQAGLPQSSHPQSSPLGDGSAGAWGDGSRRQESFDSPGRSLGRTHTDETSDDALAEVAGAGGWESAVVLDQVTLRLDAVA